MPASFISGLCKEPDIGNLTFCRNLPTTESRDMCCVSTAASSLNPAKLAVPAAHLIQHMPVASQDAEKRTSWGRKRSVTMGSLG